MAEQVTRAWGSYKVLDNQEGWAVKELTFEPGKSLSDQRHFHRSEHWHIVSGKIQMVLQIPDAQKRVFFINAGQSIDIPVNTWHKAKNIGDEPAKVIEVWMGENLTEDDIERRD